MAILKHIASKNTNYGSAIDYLKYQHDEFHLVPVLDESGNMMLREEFYLEGLNCDPETFDLECELLNQEYNKNNAYDEIKSHHYIISHDPKDNTDHNLTGEWAQAIGMEYAKVNFPGHQALVCTHTDGKNGTGNIHTHIIINSLRKFDVDPQPFTERPIDCKAGYKHHLNLAPQEIRIDLAVLPETNCQGLFNQIHKKSTKRCQKHRMAPDTSFDRLHFSVQQVFAEIRIVWQLVDIWLPAPLDFGQFQRIGCFQCMIVACHI